MILKDGRRRKLGSATGDIVCWPLVLLTVHLKAIMTGKWRVEAGKEHEMKIRGGRGRGRGRGGEGGGER